MKKRWIAIPLALVLCIGAGVGAYFYMNQEIRPDYGVYQYTDETGTGSSISLTKDSISFQNFDFSDYEYAYALSCRLSDIQNIRNEGGTVSQEQMDAMLEHYLQITDYSRFENATCSYRYQYDEEDGLLQIRVQENGEDVPALLFFEEPRTKTIQISDSVCYTLQS